jgi:peptidoglycan/xylan/chitin deacetylase (PgdA/CDA1 family)
MSDRFHSRADLIARRLLLKRRTRRQRLRALAAAGLVLLVALLIVDVSTGTHHKHAAAHGRLGLVALPPRSASGLARADQDIARVFAYTPYVAVGAGHRRDVALTFDDGPGPSTPKLLALLQHYHVPATFFVVGYAVRRYPGLLREEARRGYPIGNHTADHAAMARFAAPGQEREIVQLDAAARAAGVSLVHLFRPPYGSFNATTFPLLRGAKLLMVLWTVDSKDFARPGTQRIVYTVLSGARPGAIFLMHDGGGDRSQTIAALPRIIKKLRKRHFHLVTVPRLLRDDPPPHNQPPPRPLSGAL